MADSWVRLAAPFPSDTLRWRVAALDPAERRALLAPELDADAIVARLDDVLGREGWSQRYLIMGADAIICELEIAGVHKAGLVARRVPGDDPERLAGTALARAAERFGLMPPADPSAHYWVDADPETGEPLHDPVVAPATGAVTSADPVGVAKPEGQQALDRLVERLRDEGLGLEAARLLIAYGGYGQDADTARDLYGKLRALLVQRGDATSVGALP